MTFASLRLSGPQAVHRSVNVDLCSKNCCASMLPAQHRWLHFRLHAHANCLLCYIYSRRRCSSALLVRKNERLAVGAQSKTDNFLRDSDRGFNDHRSPLTLAGCSELPLKNRIWPILDWFIALYTLMPRVDSIFLCKVNNVDVEGTNIFGRHVWQCMSHDLYRTNWSESGYGRPTTTVNIDSWDTSTDI